MQSGNREEMFDSPSQQRSVLPLSIVPPSICFLPSSAYLSGRVTLPGLGLTSANRQGHAVRTACAASSSLRAASFLFVTSTRALARRPTLFYQRFAGRKRIEKRPVCVSLCVRRLWEGPAPSDHQAIAYPTAGFAASSAKKSSTGLETRGGHILHAIGLYMCVCVCVCELVQISPANISLRVFLRGQGEVDC